MHFELSPHKQHWHPSQKLPHEKKRNVCARQNAVCIEKWFPTSKLERISPKVHRQFGWMDVHSCVACWQRSRKQAVVSICTDTLFPGVRHVAI
eukprot:1160727-Pelagomonas_calceolata.AAC.8